jgi:hypothetical protein
MHFEKQISAIFGDARSVHELIDWLKQEGSDWATETLQILDRQCPLSLLYSFESMNRGAQMDKFSDVL